MNKNDAQHSSVQEHIKNRTPASCEQDKIPSHKNEGKLDERINTETQYGRISRKPDRLTYH